MDGRPAEADSAAFHLATPGPGSSQYLRLDHPHSRGWEGSGRVHSSGDFFVPVEPTLGCDPLEQEKGGQGTGHRRGEWTGNTRGQGRRCKELKAFIDGARPRGKEGGTMWLDIRRMEGSNNPRIAHPWAISDPGGVADTKLFFLKGVAPESGFHRIAKIARVMNPATPFPPSWMGRSKQRYCDELGPGNARWKAAKSACWPAIQGV